MTELEGFAQGAFWVMDPAAASVASLARGATVLDACAAPGGKTAFLASRGAAVTAVDASEPRLARLRDNLARLRLAADVRTHDWTTGPLDGLGAFDVVADVALLASRGSPMTARMRKFFYVIGGSATSVERSLVDDSGNLG